MAKVARIVCGLALAFMLAACQTTSPQSSAGLQSNPRTTVAFESIDGPPPAVFQNLVNKLNEEADLRRVPVVTREGFSPYRVRGYTAVGINKGQAVVAWVWDVYDAQSVRVLRLSGEEKAGKAGKDAWQAVNDEVVGRIARNGMQQLASYLQTGPQGDNPAEPAAPAPAGTPGIAVAEKDDKPSDNAGITASAEAAQAQPQAATPAAKRSPARSGRVALAATR